MHNIYVDSVHAARYNAVAVMAANLPFSLSVLGMLAVLEDPLPASTPARRRIPDHRTLDSSAREAHFLAVAILAKNLHRDDMFTVIDTRALRVRVACGYALYAVLDLGE